MSFDLLNSLMFLELEQFWTRRGDRVGGIAIAIREHDRGTTPAIAGQNRRSWPGHEGLKSFGAAPSKTGSPPSSPVRLGVP